MRITHLCLGCFFPDGYSYQENILPKYHKNMGHQVTVIASLQTYDKDGHLTNYQGPLRYINEYNIPVIRLAYQYPERIYKKLKKFIGTYDALVEANPEVLFIHGCQFMDVNAIVRYKKTHPQMKIFVDNHADFKNSAKSFVSRNVMHKILWRIEAKKLLPICEKFYGVLPARVRFLNDVYKIPNEKIELMCIGADDEYINKYSSVESRKKTRNENGYLDDDVVIVTGGKINSNRPETLELMKAVISCKIPHIKLLVFGVVDEAYKSEFDTLCSDEKIKYIGWLSPEQTYEAIAAADLVAFPGLHSVMWEQAVAQGVPCLFRSIPGFEHVDIGGNVFFCKDVSKTGLLLAIEKIFGNEMRITSMKESACKNERKKFYYSEIARKCIEH